MITLTQNDKDAVINFAIDCRLELHMGKHIGCFKPRHFKKALKKQIAGLPLMPSEVYWLQGDGEPLYDMDGGYYHAPEDGGMGYPEPEGGFPEFSEYATPEIGPADWRR